MRRALLAVILLDEGVDPEKARDTWSRVMSAAAYTWGDIAEFRGAQVGVSVPTDEQLTKFRDLMMVKT